MREIRVMGQGEFGDVAYEVMERAFAVHNELGRFFDEKVYQRELAFQLGDRARIEVPLRVAHGEFRKTYFMDLLVDSGALFELKAVERLADTHRSQLLNYLLLAELEHGKLINFRPQSVEHEFVNTTLTHADRTRFVVQNGQWNSSLSGSDALRDFIVELLRDWGTCLGLHLYEEAVTDFLGGPDVICQEIDVVNQDRPLGTQTVQLLDPQTTFKITALSENLNIFETQIHRFLSHTPLQHVHWINITLTQLTFKTLSK